MKKDTLFLLGSAAIAAYLVMKAGSVKGAVANVTKGATEIFNSLGQRFSNGWRYFSDGTSIDPQGNYWSKGTMVWSPPVIKAPTSSGMEAVFNTSGLTDV